MSATSPFLPQGSPQCRVTELSVPASKLVNGIDQIYSWCLERPVPPSPIQATCTTEINRYGSIMSIGDASTYASYYTITSPSGRFFSSDTAPYCVDVSPSDSMTWEASSVESQNKLCFSSSPCPSTTTSNYYPDNYDSCDWFCKFLTLYSIASAVVTLTTHPHHASAPRIKHWPPSPRISPTHPLGRCHITHQQNRCELVLVVPLVPHWLRRMLHRDVRRAEEEVRV